MDDFDRLLKDALDSDIDLEGLTVDEDLVASTLKAIDEAAPRKEEIRAEYDESFAAAVLEAVPEEPAVQAVPVAPVAEFAPAPRKKFFTGKRIATITGIVAGLAAVVVAAVFLGSGLHTSEMSKMDSATMSATTTNTADYAWEGAAEAPAAAAEAREYASFDAEAYSVEDDGRAYSSAVASAAPEEDGLYYFDDDDYYADSKSDTSELLNNVYMLGDKDLYKPILDAVRAVAEGEPEVSNPMQYSEEEAAAGEPEEPMADIGEDMVITGASGDDGTAAAGAEEDEEEFDINDPTQLAQALAESQQMLKETGGGPSDKATEVIGSIEVNGETVPDFDYSPEKSPFWVDVEDASDEALAEYSPLIVIYDQDNEADFDVCVQVFTDRCVVYDFAFGTTTTYTVADGQALADTLRDIVGQ